MHPSRREVNQKLLGSLMAFGLIETVFRRGLFAESVKPIIGQWLTEMDQLGRDLKDHKLKDIDFQAKLEALYSRVDLAELLKRIDLDKLLKDRELPARGAASLGFDTTKIERAPQKFVFGKQIFAMNKDRSVVPHGHDNMSTGFLILRGDFIGKHYDRLEDNKDHYIIKPTIDRKFVPGECSTISDHKDNVHWFKAQTDGACILNIHVMGYNPENKNVSSRVYIDPDGEKVSGGLIVAKKISSAECHKKYG